MPEENSEAIIESPEGTEISEGSDEETAEEKTSESNILGSLLSPIGIIMLLAAGMIDLIGFLIMCFGLDDLGIMDIIGLIFVGGLMYIHSGSITSGKKDKKTTKKTTKKVGGKIFKRLGLSFLVEIIPYLGSLVPSWTIAAYSHLKNS